jgi:hypothetical protein
MRALTVPPGTTLALRSGSCRRAPACSSCDAVRAAPLCIHPPVSQLTHGRRSQSPPPAQRRLPGTAVGPACSRPRSRDGSRRAAGSRPHKPSSCVRSPHGDLCPSPQKTAATHHLFPRPSSATLDTLPKSWPGSGQSTRTQAHERYSSALERARNRLGALSAARARLSSVKVCDTLACAWRSAAQLTPGVDAGRPCSDWRRSSNLSCRTRLCISMPVSTPTSNCRRQRASNRSKPCGAPVLQQGFACSVCVCR